MSAVQKVLELKEQVRRVVPPAAIPWLAKRRVDQLWQVPEFRESQIRQMELLLAATPRAHEVPVLARRMAEHGMARRWLRWHPRVLINQRVEGLKWFHDRDMTRPMLLSFMHHAQYEGMFPSLVRKGVPMHALGMAEVLSDDAPIDLRQHIKVASRGVGIASTADGSAGLKELMVPGRVLAIASDVPSRSPVEFLGRRFRGSSGAARIAMSTDAPVTVVTSVRDGERSHHLQVHEPLDPRDFGSPEELLAEMLRIHGEAILAWPEATDNPETRWGLWEEDAS